jgi:hypothetical protein
MKGHTKGNNLVILTKIQEFGGVVAVVAVHNQQMIYALYTRLCILIEML